MAPPPTIPGSVQPPRMFGMPPPPPNQSMAAMPPAMSQTGAPLAGPSKIDPNQIPRPIPNTSVILHETRQGNQANPPPVFHLTSEIKMLEIFLFDQRYVTSGFMFWIFLCSNMLFNSWF